MQATSKSRYEAILQEVMDLELDTGYYPDSSPRNRDSSIKPAENVESKVESTQDQLKTAKHRWQKIKKVIHQTSVSNSAINSFLSISAQNKQKLINSIDMSGNISPTRDKKRKSSVFEPDTAILPSLTADLPDIPPPPQQLDIDSILLSVEEEKVPELSFADIEQHAASQYDVVTVDAERVVQRRLELEEFRIQQRRNDEEIIKNQQDNFIMLAKDAENRLNDQGRQVVNNANQLKKRLIANLRSQLTTVDRQFRQAKHEFEKDIEKQSCHIDELYGSIQPGQTATTRRSNIIWDNTPQPLELKLKVLRGVKDKLGKGDFVIMATQYDKLGGNLLTWSKQTAFSGIDEKRTAISASVRHNGNYKCREITFNSSVFLLCPAVKYIEPSNCVVLELIQMRSDSNPRDTVVGWCAFPLIDNMNSLSQVFLKLPFVRGEYNKSYKLYSDIDDTISNDLSSWLCNIYLETSKLPREILKGGKLVNEYDVEFDFIGCSVATNYVAERKSSHNVSALVHTKDLNQSSSSENISVFERSQHISSEEYLSDVEKTRLL